MMLRAVILTLCFFINSCAYIQTHKNVEEIGSHFEGEILNAGTMALYKYKDQWYLSAHRASFKLSYPIVHDSIFRKNDSSPQFNLTNIQSDQSIYHPISSYAAFILQQKDGYFQLSELVNEIQRTSGEWVDKLPGAQRYPILAEIGDKQIAYMEDKRVPSSKLFISKVLGKIDFIVVDVPGTILYNVAIPIMAPFVFFYEFAQGE